MSEECSSINVKYLLADFNDRLAVWNVWTLAIFESMITTSKVLNIQSHFVWIMSDLFSADAAFFLNEKERRNISSWLPDFLNTIDSGSRCLFCQCVHSNPTMFIYMEYAVHILSSTAYGTRHSVAVASRCIPLHPSHPASDRRCCSCPKSSQAPALHLRPFRCFFLPRWQLLMVCPEKVLRFLDCI